MKDPIWVEPNVISVKSASRNKAAVVRPTPKPVIAPYITKWSSEVDPPGTVIEVGGGIGYADEKPNDRDRHGVLWARAAQRPGEGRPLFARVHPFRQRRAMRMLLCGVCGGPADRDEDGVLWLLTDHRDDWPDWPARMAAVEPPVCRPCVHLSVRLCPALRRGAVAVRARRYPITAVRGARYTGGQRPRAVEDATVFLDDPRIRWVKAVNLARTLQDCTVIEVDDVRA